MTARTTLAAALLLCTAGCKDFDAAYAECFDEGICVDAPGAEGGPDAGADAGTDAGADAGALCGNGQLNTGEECDPGAAQLGTWCRATCKLDFAPSHLDRLGLPYATGALSGVTRIDTTSRTVTGVNFTSLPAGSVFISRPGYAVLLTGTWTVDADVTVTGDVPLLVVATDSITVVGKLDAAAVGTVPGPGGAAASVGPFAAVSDPQGGRNGPLDGTRGGGGGALLGAGGVGGSNTDGGVALAGGGNADAGAALAQGPLRGGGAGGWGGYFEGRYPACTGDLSRGGGGGGAVQLTAWRSITVTSTGVVTAGGGGGAGGCSGGEGHGGGGGGAGGVLWLEARTVRVDGWLTANGGGGGGGGGASAPGGNGVDALATDTLSARGGYAANDSLDLGRGGVGGARSYAPGGSGLSPDDTGFIGGGGGGGSTGYLLLRGRDGAPTFEAAQVSPAPAVAQDFAAP